MCCEHRNISRKRICWFAVPLILIHLVLCMHSSVLMSSCRLCSHAGLPRSFPLGTSVPGLSLLSWWTSWVHAFLPMFWQCSQSFQWMCVGVVGGCLNLAFACFLCWQSAVASCLVCLSSPTLCPSFLLLPSLHFFSFFSSTSFPSSPLSTIARVTTPYSPPQAGCHTLKYLPIRPFPPLFLVLTCGSNPL